MEQESNNNDRQEQIAPLQEGALPSTTAKAPDGNLPQGSGPLHQPAGSGEKALTEGGAYLAGSVHNVGGVNIFGGKVTIDQGSTLTRSVSPMRPENYIPFPRNPLFQPRPGEFEELERLLFDVAGMGPKRLGLVGMGGVGKSQLATQLAYHCLDENRYPDGIFWLTATGNMDDWRRSLAELALKTSYLPPEDLPSNPDTEVRRAQYLCRYFARHSGALLILDNVDDPGLVVSAFPALIGEEIACTLLYTSRVTRVPIGITTYLVDRLPQEAALRLLLASTRPAQLTEILNGSQSVEVLAAGELCEVVGYLPLALVHLRAVLYDDQEILLTELLAALRKQGALEVANNLDPDAAPLIATFSLSWEKVKEPEAQRLFKLAAYFPETVLIPLWLLGLAAGLGERTDGFTPLGRMWLRLLQVSLLEKLSKDQVRLHPLVRAFGQRLVSEDGDKGQALLKEAGEHLVSEFTHVNKLEKRAIQHDYWACLEQVRAARKYLEQLGIKDQIEQVERVEQWLDRESYLLGDKRLWPQTLPGLFYQQLFNRSVEDDSFLSAGEVPTRWLRQLSRVGAEDRSLLRVFVSHFGDVKTVAFSPDGTKVLTGSNDRTARLWETASGKLLMTLTSHTDWVRSVTFSPDGTKVLTGSSDRTARLWETASGRLLATFAGHGREVESVTFSPDGTKVLTGSNDRTARLWETASGRLLATFAGHEGGVRSVAFSPDGTKVLTGSADRTTRLWEAASGGLLATLKGHKGGVRSVAFSPDGAQVLTGSSDWTARLWDRASGKQLATLVGHFGRVMGVTFSPDGMRILTGSEDQTARLWDRASGKHLTTFVGHTGRILSVAFSSDGMRLLTGSSDRTARLWKTPNGNLSTALKGHTGGVKSMAFSSDGMQLLTGSDDQTARLWETASGRLLATLKGHAGRVTGVAFSSDGTQAITGSSDRTARLWETASGKLLRTIEGHANRVRSAAFSPDGTRVLTGSDDQTTRLWEAASGGLLATLEGHAGGVWSVVFSPDGTRILTGSDDQTARLWEAASGRLLATLEGHAGGVRSMAFSSDGTKMLIGSVDGTAQLWETTNGKLLATLEGHTGWVMITVFAPDGRLMMTCDQRGHVFLWRATGVEIGSLLDIYVATYEVGAVHWQNTSKMVLADRGGPWGYPHFYHLKLEGTW